jgi:hypothetical protein
MPDSDLRQSLDDEFEDAFPGCTLTHVITVIGEDRLSLALEALRAVQASGGALAALHLVRRGGAFEHQLRLVGLRPRQARVLTDRLSAMPGVERAVVEHQILSR